MDNRLQDVQVERPRAGAAVVVFTGEHDLSTSEPVEALLGSLIEENELVVVDFSEAEFVDSSTIYALVKSHRAASERGSTFRLQLGTAPIVEKAFELSGMLKCSIASPPERRLCATGTRQMSTLEDEQEKWERDCRAWNLPRPRGHMSLAEDLFRSLEESAVSRTNEEASSQRPTQGIDDV